MSLLPEFCIDSIAPGSKGIFSFTVDLPEGLQNLPRQSFLASSGFCSEDRMAAEMAAHVHKGKLSIPILAARGNQDGQTMIVTAGIHGDEYEGMEAIYRVFDVLDPERMKGTFVAAPIVTLPAFWMGIRSNPVDLKNMARVFPGKPNGSFSERLAWELLHRLLQHASLYIDLHSSGRNYRMLTLCGYSTVGKQSVVAREAAFVFGAPVVWAHSSTAPGRTLSATLERGIPSLYTEAYGGGHVRPIDLECYTNGLANILKLLDITVLDQVGLPDGYRPRVLGGSGNMDVGIKCQCGGLFFPSQELGATVRAGAILGIVRSLEGRIIEEVSSPQEGVLILIRATPRIYPGENVAALASEG